MVGGGQGRRRLRARLFYGRGQAPLDPRRSLAHRAFGVGGATVRARSFEHKTEFKIRRVGAFSRRRKLVTGSEVLTDDSGRERGQETKSNEAGARSNQASVRGMGAGRGYDGRSRQGVHRFRQVWRDWERPARVSGMAYVPMKLSGPGKAYPLCSDGATEERFTRKACRWTGKAGT